MRIDAVHLALLLYSEVNIISVVMMLIIAYSAYNLRQNKTHRTLLFITSVTSAAISNVCDFIWNLGITGYIHPSINVSWFVNSLYFFSLGECTYAWFMYSETVFGGSLPQRRFRRLAAIPLGLLIVLMVATRFTGCAFYFDANGIYHRGKLFYLQHILSYSYVLITSVMCVIRAAKSVNYDRREELLAMSVFIVPPIISTLLQFKFQTIPILAVGIMVSFLLVFISMQQNMITTDELTEIPNRREILRHLAAEIKNPLQAGNLYFLFLDIDNFKQVNDKFGHAEGDRTLKVLAAVLRQISAEAGGFCARYGGDEFAVVLCCDSEDELLAVRRRIHADAETKSRYMELKTVLSVSIGCAKYSPEMSGIAELISIADTDMYRKKQLKKAQRQN